MDATGTGTGNGWGLFSFPRELHAGMLGAGRQSKVLAGHGSSMRQSIQGSMWGVV